MPTLRVSQCIPAIIVPVTFSILIACPASAATITSTNANGGAVTIAVTNTNDSGPGSLRNAITGASSGDTIQFHLTSYPATITLSSTLNIDTNLTISGPGASNLAISGNGAVRVFQVASGIMATFSGVTIENGSSSPYDNPGSGILNYGTVSLINSTVSGNGNGGINGGTVSLINSTVSGNSADVGGGGISAGTVSLISSIVSGNFTFDQGGGIYADTVSLINSTVSGNHSDDAGGGIFVANGTVSLINSTVSSNGAGYGGGIYGEATLVNSTVSFNVAGYYGGGIYGGGTLSSSTVAFNVAEFGGGGGIYGGASLKNTILAGNTDFNGGGNCTFLSGSSYGHNISDDNSCSNFFNTAIGDLNNAPAGLDPNGLANNGGPTQTIALLPTSPAVNAIPLNYCTAIDGTPIATDQRGLPRPQGSGCDIGAYEYLAITAPAPTSGSNCNGAYNGSFKGNIEVSTGQNCIFFEGGVGGNVQQNGGSLVLFQSQVGGNVQVNGSGKFTIDSGSTIRGNLEIQNLPHGSSQNLVCGITVQGNLEFQNSGTSVLIGAVAPSWCAGNTISGNLQVQNNWGATTVVGNTVSGNLEDQNNSGLTQVFNNTVSGNLQCQNDTSIKGGGNTARQKQGQCAGF